MIVEPDFLTHWKTQMLIIELGDKAAPLYVLALWAHCQLRRSDHLDTRRQPNALKAICRYEGEASKLSSALERCGWIDASGDGFVVHGWAETNAKMMANWTNGPKGGRPPKEKAPQEEALKINDIHTEKTQPKPNRNPNITHSDFGVTQTEPVRVDKSREELRDTHKNAGACEADVDRSIAEPSQPKDLAQAIAAGAEIGMSPEQVELWYAKRTADGWMIYGSNGFPRPVRNWRTDLATAKAWGGGGGGGAQRRNFESGKSKKIPASPPIPWLQPGYVDPYADDNESEPTAKS